MSQDRFEVIDEWKIIEWDNDLPTIVRVRDKLDKISGKNIYPHLLQISWIFANPSENGMPYNTESNEVREFEDLLVNSLEVDLQSILTFVATYNGLRIFFFYTKNIEEFSARLHNIPQKQRRYPIELYCTENEGWNSYEEITGENPIFYFY